MSEQPEDRRCDYGEGSTKTHSLPRIVNIPPLKELDDIYVEEEIRGIARSIYSQMKIINPRGENRKLLIFFVLREAYLRKGIVKDQTCLAELVGLNKSRINYADRIFSESQTGFRPTLRIAKPQELIPDLASRILSSESINLVTDFSNPIIEKKPELLEKHPRDVAVALLYFFMKIHGFEIVDSEFSHNFDVSDQTIKSICSIISTARS
mgnify:FL=1